MPILKEDIEKITSARNCPTKENYNYADKLTGVITVDNIEDMVDKIPDVAFNVSKSELENYDNNSNSNSNSDGRFVPNCNDDNFTDGCCTIDSNPNENKCKKGHSTGVKILAKDGNKIIYSDICHYDPIEEIFNSFLSDPNKLTQFFKLIVVWIITLLLTSFIGICYEFWFRFSNAPECIYYKVGCVYNEKSKTDKKVSIVDFVFPSELNFYPYQPCNGECPKKCKITDDEDKKQQNDEREIYGGILKGGKKFAGGIMKGGKEWGNIQRTGDYLGKGKCIKANDTSDKEDNNERIMPYRLVDIVDCTTNSTIVKTVVRAFVFFFMFPLLFVRKALNMSIKAGYDLYKKIEFNPFMSNVLFLFFTGLIFPLISYASGYTAISAGPGLLLGFVLSASNFIVLLGALITFFVVLSPASFIKKVDKRKLDKLRFNEIYCDERKNENDMRHYYKLLGGNMFYQPAFIDINANSLLNKIKFWNIIKNILVLIFLVPVLIIFTLIGSFAGMFLSMIYTFFSILFNFFYLPLSNPLESLGILASHSDLLIILFCVGVIGSSAKSFHPHTTGIMSIILAIIIFFKVSKGLTKSV